MFLKLLELDPRWQHQQFVKILDPTRTPSMQTYIF